MAGMVTDLLVPLSAMEELFATQVAGAASVAECSKVKSAVSADGQETITPLPERSTERVGRGRRYARAMYADTFLPAVVK